MTKKLTIDEMKEMLRHGKLVFPSQEKIKLYPEEVARILEAIGHPEAWVSDESSIGNFYPALDLDATEEEITDRDGADEVRLQRLLGVDVAMDDLLWQVAQRMREGPMY